jgi:hypothetical protein
MESDFEAANTVKEDRRSFSAHFSIIDSRLTHTYLNGAQLDYRAAGIAYAPAMSIGQEIKEMSMETVAAVPPKHPYRRTGYVFLAAGCVLIVLAALVGMNDNPPAIVCMFAGLLAVALGIIYWASKAGGRKPLHQLLYWTPRALGIVFALFISLFALDVFSETRGFWNTLLALTMHLIPTFLMLIVLAVSWRREFIAGIIFPLLGVLYIVWAWNKPFGVLSTFLLMAGPLVLTGGLFLLNWYYRGILRGKS